jgi:hypothetical protein
VYWSGHQSNDPRLDIQQVTFQREHQLMLVFEDSDRTSSPSADPSQITPSPIRSGIASVKSFPEDKYLVVQLLSSTPALNESSGKMA